MTPAEPKQSRSKKPYIVYAAYAYADVDKGEILSRHRTYEAARKKAGSPFLAIRVEDEHEAK
jgi:hypothetical protein